MAVLLWILIYVYKRPLSMTEFASVHIRMHTRRRQRQRQQQQHSSSSSTTNKNKEIRTIYIYMYVYKYTLYEHWDTYKSCYSPTDRPDDFFTFSVSLYRLFAVFGLTISLCRRFTSATYVANNQIHVNILKIEIRIKIVHSQSKNFPPLFFFFLF